MEEAVGKLVQSLADECAAHGIEASPALVAYTIRSVISQNAQKFASDPTQTPAEEAMAFLRDEAKKLLSDPESVPMANLRMQVDMDLAFAHDERQKRVHAEKEAAHIGAIEQELVATRARSTAAQESLYRKIVSYGIIDSKWGSPNDPQIVRQATAAQERVFPLADVPKFVAGADVEKRKHLKRTSELVLGVRVYQAFGGASLEPAQNLRVEVPKRAAALVARIKAAVDAANGVIMAYVEAIKAEGEDARLIDELANRRQYLAFLEVLLAKANGVGKEADKNAGEFDSLVQSLRGLIELGESVPAQKAFPLFSALAEVWGRLRVSDEEIKSIELLLGRLRKHADGFRLPEGRAVAKPAEAAPPAADAAVIPKEADLVVDDSKPTLLRREDETGEFAFNGFCCVTLVRRQGLLLPGDSLLGAIRWERKYFAFADAECRAAFEANPAKWNADAIAVARARPELVALLGLHGELPSIPAPRLQVHAVAPPPTSKTRDAGVETEIHPIETFIDPTYHWNQWELMRRRKVLKGLEDKRTRSVQTDGSVYRRTAVSQTFQLRDSAENTRVDFGASPPRVTRYVAGLRGDTQTATGAKIVSLTWGE